jgi:hypothetical protein
MTLGVVASQTEKRQTDRVDRGSEMGDRVEA